jgi:hypothetical protein
MSDQEIKLRFVPYNKLDLIHPQRPKKRPQADIELERESVEQKQMRAKLERR